MRETPVIDAHQHFWKVARGDYGWLRPELGSIFRDFGPADLAPILARHRIEKTVVVQAAPTVSETEYLLELAKTTVSVAGVVGWADFEARDIEDVIARLSANRLLVGLRPMVQDIADDDWLLRPALDRAFRAMVRHRLVFDALVLPRHLTRLIKVVEHHPDLSVVVDHLAKPDVAGGSLDPWRDDMAALGQYPQVFCKLSGMVTEASANWSVADLLPYAQHVLKVFGPQRIVWGSDWPVVDLGGGYDAWRAATLEILREVSSSDRDAILGGNAVRLYLSDRGRL